MSARDRQKLFTDAASFLSNLDADWARAIDVIGPCTHEPKTAREPYEALIRAVAYQQLTAKAGDAIIGRLCAEAGGVSRNPTPFCQSMTENCAAAVSRAPRLRPCRTSRAAQNRGLCLADGKPSA